MHRIWIIWSITYYRRTESKIIEILLVIIRRNYDNASITAINTGYLFQVLQILFTFFFQKHDFRHQLHMPIFAQECIDYNTGIQVGTSIKITVHNCLLTAFVLLFALWVGSQRNHLWNICDLSLFFFDTWLLVCVF